MPTLQELRAQIADLEKQAGELHDRESREAIATVRELVDRYGLTAEQVGFAPAPSRAPEVKGDARKAPEKSTRPGAGVAKFADPETGKTWTGFGKPPGWIAASKDRNAFRIGPPAAEAAGGGKALPRKAGSKRSKTA